MYNSFPEILAPAGNFLAMKAAIANGADAVYLGLNKFNAREKADNFAIENIKETIDYAHMFGVKVYITLNTLLKDTEIEEALKIASEVWNQGADAFIIQDLGLCELLKANNPEIILHASTQMGIHNYYGAIVAEKLGFKRIVLSRETTLEDIKLIRKNSNIELEYFVHGALCVAFSGNCYFSSMASGYSGNRGRCMQLCRKKYNLSVDGEEKSGYFLSAKDIMLSDKLDLLKNVGIDSFKIEGRLRRPEYVAAAVNCYKKALNHTLNNEDIGLLKISFNRGEFCKAHLENPTSDIIYPLAPNNIGINAGYVVNRRNKTVELSKPLKAGDGIKFTHFGAESGSASIKSDGNITGFSGNPQKGDEVRLTSSASLSSLLSDPKKTITAEINATIGTPLKIKLKTDTSTGESESEYIIGKSEKTPTDSDEIIGQMKFGDTDFSCSNVLFKGDNNIFIPKSIINSTRRNAVINLKNNIINSYNRQKNSSISMFLSDIISNNGIKFLKPANIIQIDTPDKLSVIPKNFTGYISISPGKFSKDYLQEFAKTDNVILSLPNVIRHNDMEIIQKAIEYEFFNGFIINNIYGLELLKNKKIILGWQMNFINSVINQTKISSPEADREITNCIKYTFGYVPIMTLTHCPKRSLGKLCDNCKQNYSAYLTDEMHNTFSIAHYSINYCYARILNKVPLYREIAAEYKFIDLSYLPSEICKELIPKILNGNKIDLPTTKGNTKRGLV